MTYSFDTSALMDAWHRYYPPDVFESLWERIDQLIQDGVIKAVDEVLYELERKEDALHMWAKKKPAMFIPLDAGIQNAAREVLAEFPKMLDERTGKNMADPFVVALAKVNGYTVVTAEKGGNTNRPKIPNVCRHFEIPCMDVLTMFRSMQWKF